ncbi:NEAT domain-containing protein [Paenibacillus hunanensis]|uniref:NEAT domain-containing protein n=1 Tax=Paenibacillus hunanensis TaxID=539262 RepID=UPI00202671BA|nr:NEAT domain-containing protein [Paenibacillus hunanensis]MCL9662413.1 NEAT domain-containing protein [Paenibacillus hunanensis]WPP40772.1 NEAT domain-containing protein [Paenibacillus hunanensis]
MHMTMNRIEKGTWLKAIIIAMVVALVGALMAPWTSKADAAVADGAYFIEYTVYANGTNNPSYMDSPEYSRKPATLIVSGGKATVKVTLNHKDWIQSFKTQQNGTYVAAPSTTSGDTVTYTFPVSDLSAKVNAQIRVVVPAEIAGQAYDHTYTVQYLFDQDSIE